jgi:CRP-like cAMP-binding protein
VRNVETPKFPRQLIRQLENPELPLTRLGAVRALREYLSMVEDDAIRLARARGATTRDIGSALGMTRQGVSYRLKALADQTAEAAGPDIVALPDLEVTEPEPEG